MTYRIAMLVLALTLSQSTLARAATESDPALPLNVELPAGSGALILYNPGQAGRWTRDVEIWQSWQTLHYTELHLQAQPGDLVGTRRPEDLRPQVILLHPGEYVVRTFLRRLRTLRNEGPIQTEVFEISIEPGQVLIWEAIDEAPLVREVPAARLARHLERHRNLRPRRIDLFTPAVAATSAMHLRPLRMDPPLDARCLPGDRTLQWANAVAELRFEGCAVRSGRWSFGDGTQVDVSLTPDLRLGFHSLQSESNATYHWRIAQRRLSALNDVAWSREELSGNRRLVQRPMEGMTGTAPGLGFNAEALGSQQVDAAGRTQLKYGIFRGEHEAFDVTPIAYPGIAAWPHAPARLQRADGSVHVGALRLVGAAADGHLPLPEPEGTGQLRYADGSGVIAHFTNGQAEGPAWCFDDFRSEPCNYRDDARLSELGVPLRSVDTILAGLPPLPRNTAIDLLRRRHIEALLAERWEDFLQLEQDLATLGVDTGLESLFYTARALAHFDRTTEALDRLNAYLNLAGSTGAAYGEALALLDRLLAVEPQQTDTPQAAAAKARAERETFCRAELARGQRLCGCREFPELDIAASTCG